MNYYFDMTCFFGKTYSSVFIAHLIYCPITHARCMCAVCRAVIFQACLPEALWNIKATVTNN